MYCPASSLTPCHVRIDLVQHVVVVLGSHAGEKIMSKDIASADFVGEHNSAGIFFWDVGDQLRGFAFICLEQQSLLEGIIQGKG